MKHLLVAEVDIGGQWFTLSPDGLTLNGEQIAGLDTAAQKLGYLNRAALLLQEQPSRVACEPEALEERVREVYGD